MYKSIILTLACLLTLSIIGCSSGHTNPALPETGSFAPAISTGIDTSQDSHLQLGLWSVEFDTANLDAVPIVTSRESAYHFDVSSRINPSIQVLGFNPVTNVIDVNVSLTNPYNLDAFDIRLIIFGESGHMLLNPDAWTSLYDPPGGNPINPFVAFGKDLPERIITSHATLDEDISIYLPQGNRNVTFAIDASYPSNCEEPYLIENFQQDSLYSELGSSAEIQVDVYDWQSDADEVLLHCPEITGENFTAFSQVDSETWDCSVINNNGAQAGEYGALIIAKSVNSGELFLCDQVEIQITNPGPYSPEVIGSVYTFSGVQGIAAYGDYLYVSDPSSRGLSIVDISNPEEMEIINQVGSGYFDISIEGDLAFVCGSTGSTEGKLDVYDLSNPESPELLNSIAITETGTDAFLFGDYLYIDYHSEGLAIIDISTPTAPILVNSLTVDDVASVGIYGNYLYLVNFTTGLLIYDNTDPVNPLYLGIKEMDSWAMAIQGDYAYMSLDESDLAVLDLSDPADPSIVNTIELERMNSIYIEGTLLYTSGGNRSSIADISDPVNPVKISAVHPSGQNLAVHNGYLYTSYYNLYAVDISDIYNPFHVDKLYKTGIGKDMKIKGDYAYLACEGSGMSIVDLSDLSNPQYISALNAYPLMYSRYIEVKDDYAFIGEMGYSLKVIDISDSFNPEAVYQVIIPTVVMEDMEMSGNYIYISQIFGNLKIIDVTDPLSSTLVGSLSSVYCGDLAVQNDVVYAANGYGIMAIDASDHANPVQLGDPFFTQSPYEIDTKDCYLYAVSDTTFAVLDVSNPLNPFEKGQIDLNSCAMDIAISGNYAYLASFMNGLISIDISNPDSPYIVSSLDLGSYLYSIEIQDNYAFVTSSNEGLIVIRLW